jgi:cation diffusion facilitator family transporter
MSAPFADFDLPPEKKDALRRARLAEWLSLGFLATTVTAVGVTMGSSQAMKAMWVEDLVSLVPSIAFLIGAHFRRKPPDDEYPYGYRRAVLIAYQTSAVALLGFGLWIFGDSAAKLVQAEHPTIQTAEVFGHRFWLGWPMIAALVYSVFPPYFLGRWKKRLATELNDKALYTSAELNKGDWLSAVAAVAGILGIGFGLWWADSAAAGLISLEIIKDGWGCLHNSVGQLMNKRPTDVADKKKDPVVDKVCAALEGLGWVLRARVRLREDGDVLRGEAFVVPRDEDGLLNKLEQAADLVRSLDWRLHEVQIVPVRSLE